MRRIIATQALEIDAMKQLIAKSGWGHVLDAPCSIDRSDRMQTKRSAAPFAS